MITDIVVIRGADHLECQEWHFWFDDRKGGALVLNRYLMLARQTPRHKWKIIGSYERLHQRSSSLVVNDVPFPDDVKAEAVQQFASRIKVTLE